MHPDRPADANEPAPSPADTPGVDRRALIRRAAAAGTLAWTAPVVIDSLASPAGAVTFAASCYRAQFERSGLTFVEVTAVDGGGCTPSTCWNGRTQYPLGNVTISGGDGTNWTFTVPAGCVFVGDSVARVDNGNVCVCSTGGVGTSTIVFPGTAPGNVPFDRFKLIISCGGASCSPCTGLCGPA